MAVQDKLREKLVAMEKLRQELSNWQLQKLQLEQKMRELDLTVKELEGLGEGKEVYRIVGGIMVRVEDPKKLVEDLKEERELLELRLNTVQKQLENLEKRAKELEMELKDLIQRSSSGA